MKSIFFKSKVLYVFFNASCKILESFYTKIKSVLAPLYHAILFCTLAILNSRQKSHVQ